MQHLDTKSPLENHDLFTAGRVFDLWDPIVSTTVFHWFTPSEGNLSGAWEPLEGRKNWTGEKEWWMGQIKQMMLANIDLLYVHLIPRFEKQRESFFAAISDLRRQGYDVPKIAPFLDPFGIWPPTPVDVATKQGRAEVASHYIRFFEQFFRANSDPYAETYLARIDNRVVVSAWWVYSILQNVERFQRGDLESILSNALGRHTGVFDKGLYVVSTALIDPDLPFSDERTVFFSGLAHCVQSVHNRVHSYHIQAGYWDQNIRQPGLFMARDGGKFYRGVWEYVLQQCNPVHRIYIESWNEYDEGSGIYAAQPGPPTVLPGRAVPNVDTWSDSDDPFEYIRTTARGAGRFNRLPSNDARVLSSRCPTTVRSGETVLARVVVRNAGSAVWSNSERFAFMLRSVSGPSSFVPQRAGFDDASDDYRLYGGVFRGQPVAFDLRMRAPTIPGRYMLHGCMVHGDDNSFGQVLETEVEVV